MKRTPLVRKTPMKRSRPRKRLHAADPTKPAQQDAARRRSRGICELCGRRAATDVHHRRMRSAGGADVVENFLDLCSSCHHVSIHENPDWAYRHGLLLRRGSTGHPDPVIGCGLECEVDHLA